MRPRRHFWCGLLLNSEADSNLSCFGPPPWGLEPDKLWAFFSAWKTLLVSFIFTPFTMFGRIHTCHVLITVRVARSEALERSLPAHIPCVKLVTPLSPA